MACVNLILGLNILWSKQQQQQQQQQCMTEWNKWYISIYYRKYVSLQIVGMTASVGVGKARNRNAAMEHILKLCANLDSQHLKTVRKNWKELDDHVKKADQGNNQPALVLTKWLWGTYAVYNVYNNVRPLFHIGTILTMDTFVSILRLLTMEHFNNK